MIEAILKNKIRDINCTDAFNREDSLTASFFGLLFYLESELVEKYFYSLLGTDTGQVQEVEFWPCWNPTNTRNKNCVEPDVFVRFENLDLIIEVKRKGNYLKPEQLEDQVIAYENEYCSDESQEKQLFYLGLVRDKYGLDTKKVIKKFNELKVYKKYLKNLSLPTWNDMLFGLESIKTFKPNQQKILNDIEELLLLCNIFFQKFDWKQFKERVYIQTNNFENSLKILEQWKEKLISLRKL